MHNNTKSMRDILCLHRYRAAADVAIFSAKEKQTNFAADLTNTSTTKDLGNLAAVNKYAQGVVTSVMSRTLANELKDEV